VTLQPVLFDTIGTAEGALAKCSLLFPDGSVLAPTAHSAALPYGIWIKQSSRTPPVMICPAVNISWPVVVAAQLKSDDVEVRISNFSTRNHDQAFGWPPSPSCTNLSNPQCRNYSTRTSLAFLPSVSLDAARCHASLG
jgi:hypothetical protein